MSDIHRLVQVGKNALRPDCDPGAGRCLALSAELDKAIYDYRHLTVWGARQAAERAVATGWFDRALGTSAAY